MENEMALDCVEILKSGDEDRIKNVDWRPVIEAIREFAEKLKEALKAVAEAISKAFNAFLENQYMNNRKRFKRIQRNHRIERLKRIILLPKKLFWYLFRRIRR